MVESLIILIIQCLLFAGGIFLACKALRWMLPWVSRRLLPIFLSLFLLIGSYAFSKNDGLGAMLRSSARALTEAVARGGAALVSVHTGGSVDFTPTETAVTNKLWVLHGAHSDVITLSSDDNHPWFMKFGSNRVSRIGVTSRGTVHPLDPQHGLSMCNGYEFSILDASLGIAPRANWSLLKTPSVFWHDITSNNSLRLTWSKVLLERNTNAPISFQVEFYQSGDFIYRYDFGEHIPSNYTIGYNFQGYTQMWTNHSDASTIELYWRAFDPLPQNDSMDADNDGLSDYDEIFLYGTDPNNPDTDGDGLNDDIDENPILCDADRDGIPDGITDIADWTNHPFRAEIAGYTNLTLRVCAGMTLPQGPRLRSRAADVSVTPTQSALLKLDDLKIPLYTNQEIPLAIPPGLFLDYSLVICGNPFVRLQLQADSPLYIEGQNDVFQHGTAISGSGKIAIPQLVLIPQSERHTRCLHGNDQGMEFRPVLRPNGWPTAFDYAQIVGFTSLENGNLWLDAPEKSPRNSATGIVTFHTPWLFSDTLSANATIHWCASSGTFCAACGGIHDDTHACSHEPTCEARSHAEADCTCASLLVRVNSDDDNLNGIEDRNESALDDTEDDCLNFRVRGMDCCCFRDSVEISNIRITRISPALRLWTPSGQRLHVGDVTSEPTLLIEALTPSVGLRTEAIAYDILDANHLRYRSIELPITAANVQIKSDFNDDGVIHLGDALRKHDGTGRDTPWLIPIRLDPYKIALQNEIPIHGSHLQLSLSDNSMETPTLHVGTHILHPGTSTDADPFCVGNTTHILQLSPACTNNTSLLLTYSVLFDDPALPTLSDTLNIRLVSIDLPDFSTRTNGLPLVQYDLSSLDTPIHWRIHPEHGDAFAITQNTPTFAPPENLTNGFYTIVADFPEIEERGTCAMRSSNLNVCDVILEPIHSFPMGEECVNPIYASPTEYSKFVIHVGNPNHIPDSDIVWECNDVTFSNNVFTGRTVYLKPNYATTNAFTLKVKIANFVEPLPQIVFHSFEKQHINVHIGILSDGIRDARTVASATHMFEEANRVFKQVQMQFDIQSVSYITNRVWYDMTRRTVPLTVEISNLCDSLNTTNGLEVYFLHKIEEDTTACRIPKGIAISNYSNNRTLAHELGHACGLRDIYPQNNETSLCVTGRTTRIRVPNDCSSPVDLGYYTPNLLQTTLLENLLMYGYTSTIKSDLSFGDVYGLWYSNQWNSTRRVWIKQYRLGLVPIGFSTHGNRCPHSEN